ncbi:MAG: efflux RND transporter periplasmic adaptor subunit [Candidatus Magasanikbacteria bacterium]|nr:efflux RND transporter periplasmic adaptor subunit [Candidatus Magasanikbacteria bacterium]
MKKKTLVIVGGIVFLVVVGVVIKLRTPKVPTFSSAVVERINLQQSVTETGSVSPDVNIQFGFETSGRVKTIQKKVGDSLRSGDIIATYSSTVEEASLRQAEAALSAAQASLNLRLAGPTKEDIAKAQAGIDQLSASVAQARTQLDKTRVTGDASIAAAQSVLDTARNNLQLVSGSPDNNQIVNNSYASLVDTLKSVGATLSDGLNSSDQVLSIDSSLANYDITPYLSSGNLGKIDTAKTSYRAAKTSLSDARGLVNVLSSISLHADIDLALTRMQLAATAVQSNLYDVQIMLGVSTPTGVLTQTRLDTLKTSIATAQSSVNIAVSSLTSGGQALQTAKNSFNNYQIAYTKALSDLDTAKRQADADLSSAQSNLQVQEASLASSQASYNGLVAKPRDVDVAGLRADVARNQSAVVASRAGFDKTNLVAPADGVLANLDLEIGKTITVNSPIATIISPQVRVDLDISESDVSKVSVHDEVVITFDSFPDQKFTGSVFSIDPAQTEISGVVYYKTKILLGDTKNVGVRPGMTANVQILTDHRDNVLVIPERAILEKNGKKIVRVLTNKKTAKYEEKEIVVGLRGDEGKVEAQSGLNEGDEIITFIKEN